jgi:hypothetical protein
VVGVVVLHLIGTKKSKKATKTFKMASFGIYIYINSIAFLEFFEKFKAIFLKKDTLQHNVSYRQTYKQLDRGV